MAAGVTAGVWSLGSKMEDITVYRPEVDDKERAKDIEMNPHLSIWHTYSFD